MQALVEIIAGLVAVIAAAALSLFGLEMNPPQKTQPEIHRVRDCGDGGKGTLLAGSNASRQDC